MTDNEENTESDKGIEAEAVSMGWAPKEKYRGDPSRWIDAKEYVRRGREHIPIMQGMLSREREQRERDRQDYDRRFQALSANFEARLRATGDLASEAIRKQREQHLTELELERRRIAVSPATPEQRAEQFEHVTRAEQDLLERFREEDKHRAEYVRQNQPPPADNTPQEVLEWGAKNPWFLALKQAGSPIAQEAEAVHMTLVAQGVPLRENLDEVTRRMAERYPHIINSPQSMQTDHTRQVDVFDNDVDSESPRKEVRRPSSVEGQSSGRSVSKQAGVKGWRDIPAQEREMMTKAFINNGLYGDAEKEGLAKVQAKAAAAYWSQYPEDI